MRPPNRFRDVRDSFTGQPTERDERTAREPVDRAAARLFFKQSEEKAHETEAILDALGQGYKVSMDNASLHVKNLVRILDPDSQGEYLSWETYKKAVDLEIASNFPDLVKYERNLTTDPLANHEIMQTLIQEQMAAL